MAPAARSRSACFLLLCAAIAVLAVLHTLKAASGLSVVRVMDGETLACDDGRMIRLIGVAPFRDVPGDDRAAGAGDPSKRYLERMIGGRRVRIKPASPVKDQRGRIPAYVYAGEILLNGRMIRDGYALADPDRGYPEHELFESYESQARTSGLGIWKTDRGRSGAGP